MGAPGFPGIAPTWSAGAKDMVMTALGSSRVWATVGAGIVNEVYWPTAGRPQVRDLGFIVAGPSGWREVKRVARYRLSLPPPCLPLPCIVHEDEDYRLELTLAADPLRDVLLVSFRLSGRDARLYVLLAPHLGGSGSGNNARAADGLTAWKEHDALHLAADCGFTRASAGYVGYSDGWQDFSRNGAMRWCYPEALDGNVALMGELARGTGTLALGLADSAEGARTLALSSLGEGFDAAYRRCAAGWEAWASGLAIPEAPEEIRREAYLSAMVLKVHEGRTYPGTIVASLSIPWGNASDSPGGYHLVWSRDAVEAALALLAVGCQSEAQRVLGYLAATQHDDGGWSQNGFPDGRAFWTGVQLDEVGLPILLAAKLAEASALDRVHGVRGMIARAAAFLARNGPLSPQDRWEENPGISPFTLGVEIAALVAAAEHLPPADAGYALSLADYWNERLEDWTYVESRRYEERCGADGYYVRIAPSCAQAGLRGRIHVRNRAGESVRASALVGMDYLYLPRLGLRAASDPHIQSTLKVSDTLLEVRTPSGPAYHRYNDDGYGEHEDGRPFDGSGIGRAWPLLTGERGHLDLLLGEDPLPYLQAMARMTGRGGLIPEQVWDSAPIPERGLEPGKPSGSAMPLVWAHAEFLKLLVARQQGRPVELLKSVERRYATRRPEAAAWHWRHAAPFDTLPRGRTLLIEALEPFRLHVGFDGWRDVRDVASEPLGLGIHGVRFQAASLSARSAVDFTFYFSQARCWEGADHRVTLPAG